MISFFISERTFRFIEYTFYKNNQAFTKTHSPYTVATRTEFFRVSLGVELKVLSYGAEKDSAHYAAKNTFVFLMYSFRRKSFLVIVIP